MWGSSRTLCTGASLAASTMAWSTLRAAGSGSWSGSASSSRSLTGPTRRAASRLASGQASVTPVSASTSVMGSAHIAGARCQSNRRRPLPGVPPSRNASRQRDSRGTASIAANTWSTSHSSDTKPSSAVIHSPSSRSTCRPYSTSITCRRSSASLPLSRQPSTRPSRGSANSWIGTPSARPSIHSVPPASGSCTCRGSKPATARRASSSACASGISRAGSVRTSSIRRRSGLSQVSSSS